MTASPPTSIIVAGHPLDVIWVTDANAAVGVAGDDAQLGEVSLAGGQIRLTARDISSAYNRRDTLLHEIVHACLQSTGVHNGSDAFSSKEQAERVVSTIATLLLDTFRRNPGLVAYLMDDAA